MKITVYPSHFTVAYDNFYQKDEMKKFLTIDVPGARFMPIFKNKQWDGKKCFYDFKNNAVPIGFISRIIKRFNLQPIDIKDTRVYKPIKFVMPKLKGITLRDYQREAIFDGFDHKNCLVQAATNAGKSAIIAGLAKVLKEEGVLILTHRKEILWQLKKMIEDMIGAEIGHITADTCEIHPKINIAMILTLVNRLDTDDAITTAFNNSKVVMVDECHHGQSATFQTILRRSSAVYRFGFSGTVQEENSFDGWQTRMYIGDVVFNISNKELIDAGVSAEPKIFVHRIMHHIDYPRIHADIKQKLIDDGKIDEDQMPEWVVKQEIYKRVYMRVVRENIVLNQERNGMVVREVCGTYKDSQVLIVVDYLDHGKMLYDMLWEHEKNNVAYIHGTSETRQGSLDRFREGKLRVLISTNIIDEGIDISRIQMLFLAGGKKSRRQILQRIGRGLRRKEGSNIVHILDFYDADGKHLEKHSKVRLGIYRKEGFQMEII